MKNRIWVVAALSATIAGSAGFLGARGLAAAEKKPHMEADSAELDKTAGFLNGLVNNAVTAMKKIADGTTAENSEATKKDREAAIAKAIQPLQEESAVLLLQAHLLCLDSIADKTGEPAEQFIQENLYKKLGVEAADVAKRRETTGLGHGGLILGYLMAKVTKLPADTIFEAKKDQSWPEVMRSKNVTPTQIFQTLQDAQ